MRRKTKTEYIICTIVYTHAQYMCGRFITRKRAKRNKQKVRPTATAAAVATI